MQTQIIANIVQFAFILFTMAKEEKVIALKIMPKIPHPTCR